ncbi:MAG: methyl-accepting chemotaxis protein [Chroococcales cyanobacterium]
MFRNFTLQNRMVAAFVFMGLIILVIALIGWRSTTRLSEHILVITDNALPSAVALRQLDAGKNEIQAAERTLLSSRLSLRNRRELIEDIQIGRQEINTALVMYEQTARTEAEEQLYQEFRQNWEIWQETIQEFQELNQSFEATGIINPGEVQIELLAQDQAGTEVFEQANAANEILQQMIEYTFEEKSEAYQSLDSSLEKLIEYNFDRAQERQEIADQDVNIVTFWVIVGLIIGPLTAIIFGIYFSSVIAKPLGKKITGVVRVAERISAGDLTSQVIPGDQRDEIGKLLTAFHHMTGNLNGLIRQVQQSGIQITTSTTQIAASGKELEAAVTQQVASTNEVVATAQEIAANSGQLVQTMDEVKGLSQQTAKAASEGQKDLIQMQTTMQQLAEATSSISSKLGVISEKANNINSIVVTITKVADQTNLLSLNAAIEAEKASEYGLGFAVVAREIRRLADQTAVATLDIENMVKEMQSAVSSGVMEMDKFTKEVRSSFQTVGSISQQVGQVIEQVQSLSPRFETVSEGMEAQSQGAQQISEAMFQLKEAATQTATALSETNRAIEQLNEAAQNLSQETSRFKVVGA